MYILINKEYKKEKERKKGECLSLPLENFYLCAKHDVFASIVDLSAGFSIG
jgi:hypothetical protein